MEEIANIMAKHKEKLAREASDLRSCIQGLRQMSEESSLDFARELFSFDRKRRCRGKQSRTSSAGVGKVASCRHVQGGRGMYREHRFRDVDRERQRRRALLFHCGMKTTSAATARRDALSRSMIAA
eukprot:TRINITY_DN63431_c0_g1_i1.p1 TRINITY_DN63431_c0_g1~~TRINITY_DN63431_c0_g1_i1.p1  ORF type:complete len:126 (+),score=24.07 TRINITY_DN63431_c0_g1_i1:342-719(+)